MCGQDLCLTAVQGGRCYVRAMPSYQPFEVWWRASISRLLLEVVEYLPSICNRIQIACTIKLNLCILVHLGSMNYELLNHLVYRPLRIPHEQRVREASSGGN